VKQVKVLPLIKHHPILAHKENVNKAPLILDLSIRQIYCQLHVQDIFP